jgi:hypothetical protein
MTLTLDDASRLFLRRRFDECKLAVENILVSDLGIDVNGNLSHNNHAGREHQYDYDEFQQKGACSSSDSDSDSQRLKTLALSLYIRVCAQLESQNVTKKERGDAKSSSDANEDWPLELAKQTFHGISNLPETVLIEM